MTRLDQINEIVALKPEVLLHEDSISVSQLNKMAKNTLETYLPIMWIKGEISGLKTYSHLYFDLKDEGGKISCVMFARIASVLDFAMENGVQVEVRGRVTIYPPNGSYQISVERVRKVGLGVLWEAYARLVHKLREEGLFEAKFKQAIPLFPQAIGVITSKEGAVIRDVLTTLHRRMPNISLIIYHSAVQGSDSAMQLSRAIRTANSRNEVDVLIVCRGGGSMEDLWSFNEEVVAREVFASKIPIISAIGHETDTTIIDLVADLRAPTPTAAAELVAKSRREWLDLISNLRFNLTHNLLTMVNDNKQRVDLAHAHLKVLNPVLKINLQLQTLRELANRLSLAIKTYRLNYVWQLERYWTQIVQQRPNLTIYCNRLEHLRSNLTVVSLRYLRNLQITVDGHRQSLDLLNPSAILSRGYALVYDNNGRVVQSVRQVKQHSRLQLNFHDGRISAIADKQHNVQQGELEW